MKLNISILFVAIYFATPVHAQMSDNEHWTKDGNGIYQFYNNNIIKINFANRQRDTIANETVLTPVNSKQPLRIENIIPSMDERKFLLFTDSKKVWRYKTRGNYWILDTKTKSIQKLGKNLPSSSLMFAKISPDNQKVAYVSNHNIYVENLTTNTIKQITKDGTDRLINGTFDWAYEEEFGCRDGFRWSPDSKSIAFWQIDANKIRNFLMINNTDSIYSFVKPVEYPVVGQTPSPAKLGIVNIANSTTKWVNIPGDPAQHYLVRMEWATNDKVIVQQLNRKQNKSIIFYGYTNGTAKAIYTEEDPAWINTKSVWHDNDPTGWDWIDGGQSFLWVSEKDGWRHIYKVNAAGNTETLITKGNYDVIDIKAIDEASGYIYFIASPTNATQRYLYRIKIDGSQDLELCSPSTQLGTHDYKISPTAKYAIHTFSNANTLPGQELINLASGSSVFKPMELHPASTSHIEMTTITTDEGITMDAFVVKPKDFDSTKKYPVVFYVYSEPFGLTVTDSYGSHENYLYAGNMTNDGYIYVSIDGRGTPSPKGNAWRKSIYKKVGILNVHDQAEAAKKVLEWPWVDKERIAVWGWSGGGSTTLHLLFEHPEIYKTGISVA